ncbi:MAG: hypothetical protein ABIK43_03335, partial [candidate division WOR-3 bacterium]
MMAHNRPNGQIMILGLLLFLMLNGVTYAEVPLRSYVGLEATAGPKVLVGASAAGFSAGPLAVFGNPAVLAFARRPTVLLGYQVTLESEERTRVVFDRFENSLGEAAFADNAAAHGAFGPVAAVFQFNSLGVGVGIGQSRDFSYTYVREQRDDFYVKIGEERIEQEGAIYAANVGVGAVLGRRAALGVRVGYQLGNRCLRLRKFLGADTTLHCESGSPKGFTGGMGT